MNVSSLTPPRHQHSRIPEILTLLTSVAIATVVIVEAIAYWLFGTEPGWVALVISAIVGVAVTYLLTPQRDASSQPF